MLKADYPSVRISNQPSLEWETQKKEVMNEDYYDGDVIGRRVLEGFEQKDTMYFAHVDNIFNIKEVTEAKDVQVAI